MGELRKRDLERVRGEWRTPSKDITELEIVYRERSETKGEERKDE